MAALTGPRYQTNRLGDAAVISQLSIPLKAGAKVYAGGIVSNDAGYGIAGTTAVGKRALGVALDTVDNTGGANGNKVVEVRRGVFSFGNSSAGDAITQADLFADCYVVDDQTVAKTNGTSTRSVAGRVVGLEGNQVLVEMIGF